MGSLGQALIDMSVAAIRLVAYPAPEPEFDGIALWHLVGDLCTVVNRNGANDTPLGAAVTAIAVLAWRNAGCPRPELDEMAN